jgi:GNAT superfamily N-acetyltransferase
MSATRLFWQPPATEIRRVHVPDQYGDDLVIVRCAITDPDALGLVEAVQQEYVERYGGRDESPLDGTEFVDDNGSFFVGSLDGVAVASGAWRRRPVPEGAPGTSAVEIKRMYVVPAARGRGLARVMLAHLERTAAEAGADVVVLETGLRQPEAIALYESSGYRPIPGFGHYRGAPLSRCFAKPLVARSEASAVATSLA